MCQWRGLSRRRRNPLKDGSSLINGLCLCCLVFTCPPPVIRSKTGCTDAAYALQNLALLTPELAIPPVLEKYVFVYEINRFDVVMNDLKKTSLSS